jgi:hypothetical protein
MWLFGHSLGESATFAFGSVGQLTTVVARPGTTLRVEELAESSPCDAGEPQGPFSQAPRLSFCFRRPAGRNHRVPAELLKQPAAHFPSPCSVGYPGRSHSLTAPSSFGFRAGFPNQPSLASEEWRSSSTIPQHIGVPLLKRLIHVAFGRGGSECQRQARPEKASRGRARARNHMEGRCLEHVHSANGGSSCRVDWRLGTSKKAPLGARG